MKYYTLAEIRKERGMGQREVGRAAKRCISWAGQTERRGSQTLKPLRAYAEGLGLALYVSFVGPDGEEYMIDPWGEL